MTVISFLLLTSEWHYNSITCSLHDTNE